MTHTMKRIFTGLLLVLCGYVLCLCFHVIGVMHTLNFTKTYLYRGTHGQHLVNTTVDKSNNARDKVDRTKTTTDKNLYRKTLGQHLVNTTVDTTETTTENLHLSSMCSKLIAGDESEIKRLRNFSKLFLRRQLLYDVYPEYTKDCSFYRNRSGFITTSVSKEEEDFPIAFSILIYKHVEQFERLLRAVYRPHNVYCIHMDNKTSAQFQEAVKSIVKCLNNVFLAPRFVDVQWGKFTVLEPELICMDSLLKHKVKWKYFINLTGQEYPLKTNYELVKILKTYKGANDIEGTYKRAHRYRWTNKKPVPHGVLLRKGSVHIAASRAFISYIRTNQTALDFLEWTKSTVISDETFFTSMNYNPQLMAPGSYKGDVDDGKRQFLTRYKLWSTENDKCNGKFIRWVCIFAVGDLKAMTKAPHLFVNKFHFDFEPVALDCLQEWYFAKVGAEKNGHVQFDLSIYENRFSSNNTFI